MHDTFIAPECLCFNDTTDWIVEAQLSGRHEIGGHMSPLRRCQKEMSKHGVHSMLDLLWANVPLTIPVMSAGIRAR